MQNTAIGKFLLQIPRLSRLFQDLHEPCAKYMGEGKKIVRFSTEIAVYLGNGTRQALAHGYYGNVNRKS